MKENNIIIIGLLAVMAERIIYFARIYFVLPEYFSVLKWILLGIVVVCVVWIGNICIIFLILF